ncbi:hypothetical protein SCHPADRAFT_789604, partial [Schizopora paradoxa]
YLELVIEQFKSSYEHGTYFSKTYLHPQGILERSILALFIADLPGARKCGGMQSYSSKRNFCSTCHQTLDEINNLDMDSWKTRKVEDFKRHAKEWKDTISVTGRKNLFKEHGVRWSAFLALPYWNPLEAVIIDGMHDIFLGICAFHCRMFLEMDVQYLGERKKKQKQIDVKRLEKYKTQVALSQDKATFKNIKATEDDADVELPDHDADVLELANFNVTELDDLDRCRSISGISKKELASIRGWISGTSRPRWYASLPKNLGEAGHGKLKADQWRSALEFDIPVALAQLWGDKSSPRHELYKCTMYLAIAIRFGTSHRISEDHITSYTRNMHSYLKLMLEIDPSLRLHPNHHNSLHLGNILRRFGPMHGWWMYPFERVIGRLQKSNTNFKIGEL